MTELSLCTLHPKAKLLESSRREAGGIALSAHQDETGVEITDSRVAAFRSRVHAPLKNAQSEVQRTGHAPVR